MTFKELFLASLGYVFLYRVQLSKALLVPFLIYLSLDILALFIQNGYFSLLYTIASVMLQALIAITTHRILLLGPDHVPEWGFKSWTNRETSFSLYLVVSILILAPLAVFQVIPFAGWGITVLAIILVLPRLSLVFPAIAIGEDYSFKGSWRITKPFQAIMFFAVIMIPLIITIPIILIGFLPYTYIFTSVLSVFLTVIVVASLSVAYKYISSEAGKNS